MSRIYAFGSNGGGQLGLGHTQDVSIPSATQLLHQTFEDDHPISIAAGGNHTLVLYRSGAVFATGSNAFCCGGLRADVKRSVTFERVIFDDGVGANGGFVDRFKAVAATWEASFFVTIEDVLFVAGRGLKGELGLGKGLYETVSAPRAVSGFPPKGTSIEKIASCMAHVIVILSSGEVWGWGASRKGQLGPYLKAVAVVPEPTKLREFSDIGVLDVACGRDFTFLKVKRKDILYLLFGISKWLADWKPKIDRQGEISSSVIASWGNVYLLDSEGRISGFGRGDRGQLPPADLPSLSEVAAGSEHCLGLTRDGSVIAWGWGEHGNCGLGVNNYGTTADSFSCIAVDLEPGWSVSMVGAGCATSFVVIRRPPELMS